MNYKELRSAWLFMWGMIGECYTQDCNLKMIVEAHNRAVDELRAFREVVKHDINRLAEAVALLGKQVCELTGNLEKRFPEDFVDFDVN